MVPSARQQIINSYSLKSLPLIKSICSITYCIYSVCRSSVYAATPRATGSTHRTRMCKPARSAIHPSNLRLAGVYQEPQRNKPQKPVWEPLILVHPPTLHSARWGWWCCPSSSCYLMAGCVGKSGGYLGGISRCCCGRTDASNAMKCVYIQ